MGIAYTEEAVTTVAKLQGVIKQAILANSSGWTHVPTLASTSVATSTVAAGATSCVVASATGIAVGGVLTFCRNAAINGATNPECRVVSAVAGTTISWVDALTAPNGTYQVGDAIGVGMTVTATTTPGTGQSAGEKMVVALDGAAITAQRLQLGIYRGVSGGSVSDQYLGGGPYIYWKNAVGAVSDIVRATVSASTDHLLIAVEGPRASEANTDSATLGSIKQFVALCTVLPYFPAANDPTAAFALIRSSTASPTPTNQPITVSRDAGNVNSWVTAQLESVDRISDQASSATTFNARGLDGTLIKKPWVVMEDVAGWRGSLAKFFWGGRASALAAASDPVPSVAVGMTDTYGGNTLKCIVPQRGTQGTRTSCGFGDFGNTSTTPFVGPLLFVPIA